MAQPLIKDVDYTGIPEQLYELWYEWQVQVPCGRCELPVSAADTLVYGNVCDGKSHRPSTLIVENDFAVVPQEFITKLQCEIDMQRVTESQCVDTFAAAQQPVVLVGPYNAQVVYPVDLAKNYDIPQPPRPPEVAAGLSNMMQYIYTVERQEADGTLNPWQTLRFLPLF